MYAHRVVSGIPLRLRDIDPDADGGLNKEEGRARFAAFNAELDVMQEELYAAGSHALLLILQGMDTAGKDGAIRNVMHNLNPQGCRVESFKVPTEEELAHDFLWRVHKVVPRKGMVGVFNRSHYEDVLVVRSTRSFPNRSGGRATIRLTLSSACLLIQERLSSNVFCTSVKKSRNNDCWPVRRTLQKLGNCRQATGVNALFGTTI